MLACFRQTLISSQAEKSNKLCIHSNWLVVLSPDISQSQPKFKGVTVHFLTQWQMHARLWTYSQHTDSDTNYVGTNQSRDMWRQCMSNQFSNSDPPTSIQMCCFHNMLHYTHMLHSDLVPLCKNEVSIAAIILQRCTAAVTQQLSNSSK